MIFIKNLLSRKKIAINVLLASSLLLTLGRGLTLPFMAIYLSRQYDMSVKDVGVALTIALVSGVLFSLWFGILSDRVDKKKCLLIAIAIFLSGFIAIPLMDNAILVVICYSIINCSYIVFSVVQKGYLSETVSVALKPKIFSINYTVINIGWTIGPPLGTFAVMYSTSLPFYLSALIALAPMVLIGRYVKQSAPEVQLNDSGDRVYLSPRVMLKDKPLMWFTFSAFLGTLVYGAFSSCISQYMILASDAAMAEKVVSVVLSVNALVVVICQYSVGKVINRENIREMMGLGTVFFILGFAGFMMSGSNLWLWGLSSAVFTLGEIIYAPGEFMLVDGIAPAGLKASYFAAQQLGWLGGALNPLFTGLVLTALPPYMLFVLMMVGICLAYLAIILGMRSLSRHGMVPG